MSWAELAGAALSLLALLFLGCWLLSLRLRDSSIVDVLWGPAFAALSWLVLASAEAPRGARAWLLTVLLTAWALRLAAHVAWRGRGAGEDPRYAAWREEAGSSWWLRSLFQVFLLQGALVALLSLPNCVVARTPQPEGLGAWDLLGLLLWLFGFLFEAVADWQLLRFKSDPENAGGLLRSGLWAWSRHPNYFGEACLWWGYGCFALAVGAWWGLYAPLLMTLLLLRVSGVALLEKRLSRTKPGHADYVRETSAFLPRPPRR